MENCARWELDEDGHQKAGMARPVLIGDLASPAEA